MRRQNPISVKVKAPSRGVISRWPGETADLLSSGNPTFNTPGLLQRAASIGSNVRYEDGVVKNAPGYDRVTLETSLLNGVLAHWRLNEISDTRFDATLNHYDLAQTLGPGSTDGVGQVTGKFQQAALFDTFTVTPPVIPVGPGSSFLVDIAFHPTSNTIWGVDSTGTDDILVINKSDLTTVIHTISMGTWSGAAQILYDSINDKMVVLTYSGAILFINVSTYTVNPILGVIHANGVHRSPMTYDYQRGNIFVIDTERGLINDTMALVSGASETVLASVVLTGAKYSPVYVDDAFWFSFVSGPDLYYVVPNPAFGLTLGGDTGADFSGEKMYYGKTIPEHNIVVSQMRNSGLNYTGLKVIFIPINQIIGSFSGADIPTPYWATQQIIFNPDSELVYVADNTQVLEFSGASFSFQSFAETRKFTPGGYGLAYDPASHEVYYAAQGPAPAVFPLTFTTAELVSQEPALKEIHNASFSSSFWINPFNGGEAVTVVADRAWTVSLNPDGTLTFSILHSPDLAETQVTTSGSIVTNDWNHVVVIYNTENTTLTIYLNGSQDSVSYSNAADDSLGFYKDDFQLGNVVDPGN